MKRFFKYIIVTLFISMIIIFVKNEYSKVILRNENYGMPALINIGEVDNLYIGSSMFRQGIDSVTLDENGENNYVLAYNGNQPALEYYQLKNLIENKVKIKNIYMDMYVYSAWAQPKISDEKMLLEFGIKDKWNLWKVLSEGANADIKTFWQMFITGNNELLITWPLCSGIIDNMFFKGGSTNKPQASNEEALQAMKVNEIIGDINKLQKKYSFMLIELAKKHNINIVYIETPKYINTTNNGTYIEAMKEYIKLLDEKAVDYILCDKTLNLVGESKNSYSYIYDNSESSYYVDNGHLSYNGRVEFTKQIMNVIDTINKDN